MRGGGPLKKCFISCFMLFIICRLCAPGLMNDRLAKSASLSRIRRSLKDPLQYSRCVCCGRRLGVILYTIHNTYLAISVIFITWHMCRALVPK